MKFINEKWKNSTILTKISMGTVLLTAILLLVCAFTILSWGKALAAFVQSMGGSAVDTSGFNLVFTMYFITFLIEALFAFGIFKVVGIARILVILQGLCCLLAAILTFSGIRYVMAYARETAVATVGANAVSAAEAASTTARGLMASIMPTLLSMIPADVYAKIGFYIFVFVAPMYLPVLSMLLLFFCGKDFKKIAKEPKAK